jgi:hypothetical protein
LAPRTIGYGLILYPHWFSQSCQLKMNFRIQQPGEYVVSYNVATKNMNLQLPPIFSNTTVEEKEWNTFITTMQTKYFELEKMSNFFIKPWFWIWWILSIIFVIPTLGFSMFIPVFYMFFVIFSKLGSMDEVKKFVVSESKRYFEGEGFKLELNYTKQTSDIFITPLGTSKKKEIKEDQEVKEVVIQIEKKIDLTDLQKIQVELLQGDGFSKDDAVILVLNNLSKEDLSFISDNDIDQLKISVKGKVEIRKISKYMK